MAKIKIDKTRCKKCGMCVDICPEELFVREEPQSVPKIVRQKDCIVCGHCVSTCPAGAVIHQDFPPEAFLSR